MTESTFRCPDCAETYQPHWRDRDGSPLCRTCGASRRGECQFDTHPDHPAHPCSYGTEKPGEPCRYCAAPVPLDGSPCPACWLTFDGMPLADIKAVFAADGMFSVGGLHQDGETR